EDLGIRGIDVAEAHCGARWIVAVSTDLDSKTTRSREESPTPTKEVPRQKIGGGLSIRDPIPVDFAPTRSQRPGRATVVWLAEHAPVLIHSGGGCTRGRNHGWPGARSCISPP